ncbi:MAG TPA: exodeoxyribonuclease VII large subunit [Acidimicrobiales bacterium]|nr:exodeoxyribonuclease VII large subunit [Acidimicrobiales bacterium]
MPLFEAEPGPNAPRQVTLIRLSGEIARAVGTIGRVAVEGEVYRPVTGRTGSVFFTLRDRVAQIDVRVPAGAARRCRVVAGERVSVVATLQYSNERGQLQLVAEEVLPVGAGAIAALIATTRAALARDGLLDRPRRPIPVLPARVGVVCGTEAAVRKDIESVMAVRCAGYPVVFFETTVSGPAASLSIVEAIEALGGHPGVEVIILARGGGDAPSLLPWSTEEVCRAVAASPVPVVSAIGHDGDRPLCDEVADLRCGTPSLAATAVLPDLDAIGRAVDEALSRAAAGLAALVAGSEQRLKAVDVGLAVRAGVDRAEGRLERAAIRLGGQYPGPALGSAAARLAAVDWRRPFWEGFGRASGRLDADLRHLYALSPQRTLERGYAVVSSGGRVLRSPEGLSVGDEVEAQLAAGRFRATVSGIEPAVVADPARPADRDPVSPQARTSPGEEQR